MRLFLLLYVIIFISLNFFVDNFFVFLLAMSTFPVTVYLLVKSPKARKSKPKKQPEVREETIHPSTG